ncbi:hypothetical protein AVEN_215438-1 [Araneus ventricosus]|uniref:Uncharacterized protein n=1 Tax=Araneus ventricosus TaxID=182803 RepID=A0A4Y2NBQ1_ARAVE|nr:hypothetical protein AVEN_215438-1 [Araneus ventricosus]
MFWHSLLAASNWHEVSKQPKIQVNITRIVFFLALFPGAQQLFKALSPWRVARGTAIYKPLMSEHLLSFCKKVQTIQSTNESSRCSKAANYDKFQTRLAKPHAVGSRLKTVMLLWALLGEFKYG